MSIKSKLGWILLSSASLAAMGALTPAAAQDANDSEEIVVTATGRATAIQDVPIAVTALSGDAIENAGISDIRGLEQLAPSFHFFTGQSNTAGTNAQIRGLGTGSDNPGFEAAVGVFIDGVYRSRAGTALSDLPEVERVEILRGPQGTLFGRNTSAGALSIITAGPEFSTHAWLEGTATDFEGLGTRFGLNVPASDNLAFRFDGSMRARDGYIEDLRSGEFTNTQDRWTARGQALWDINENATLRIIADAGATNEECCYAVTLRRGTAGLAINSLMAAFVPGGVGILPGNAGEFDPDSFANPALGNPEAYQTSITPGHRPHETTDEWGISGQLDWDLGGVELTSITGYRDWDSERDQDIDFSDFDRAYRDGLEIGFETLTQEFRLHGQAGRVDWLVGAFFGNEQLEQTDRIRFGAQAANYVDALASGVDINGPAPGGTGFTIFRSLGPGSGDFFANTMPAFAGVDPGDPTLFANLLAGLDPADGDGQQADEWNVETNSIALFTHNEISITDQLLLTVGVRFNHEEKEMSANLDGNSPACSAFQNPAYADDFGAIVANGTPALAGLRGAILSFATLGCNPAVNDGVDGAWSDSLTEDEVTGTASLSYHLTDDVMIYGGYSRGYKSGGWNLDRSGFNIVPFSVAAADESDLAFDPEFVDSWEAGVKTTLFGNTNLNVTLFHETIEGFQVNAFSGFNFVTFNAPELISKGVEVDFSTQLGENFSLQGGVLYNDAYYSQDAVINPLVSAQAIPEGTPLSYASQWTVTGAATYRLPIGDNFGMLFSLDARWNDGFRVQTLSRDPMTDNDGFAIVNGRIGFGSADERWGIEIWAHNLTDEYYNVGAFIVPEQSSFGAGDPGTVDVYPSEPRMVGVTLRARY